MSPLAIAILAAVPVGTTLVAVASALLAGRADDLSARFHDND